MDYISIKNKIDALSIHYYNEGVDACKLNDMSGAIANLRKSLKCNKKNVDARNLLGLVYCSIGEYTKGMAQWIISLNFKGADNVAAEYLQKVRDDEDGLKRINENVAAYNNAIELIEAGTNDLAAMQLNKLIELDKTWVRPRVLLGLLLLSSGRIAAGRNAMREVLKLDRGCTLAKKALVDIKKSDRSPYDDETEASKKTLKYKFRNETIIEPNGPLNTTNRPKWFVPAVTAIITFLVVWLLLVPARIKSATSADRKTIENLRSQVAALDDEKVAIEKEEAAEAKTKEELKKQQKKDLKTLKAYYEQIQQGSYDATEIVEALDEMDADTLTDEAKGIYDAILSAVSPTVLRENAYNGYNAYMAGKYKKCIKYYQKVIQLEPTYYDGTCLYQLANSYAKTKDTENAIAMYQQVIALYPGTDMATAAQQYIDANSGN